MHKDIQSILLSENQINERVRELAKEIERDYKEKNPILIGILKGAFVFFADLIRQIDCPMEIDFMEASSYGGKTESNGIVNLKQDTRFDVSNRDIILVEDIIDSGYTLSFLKNSLEFRNAKSLKIVTLLDKPSRRVVELTPDYCGFVIEDNFVIGYGLDYEERFRNLPYIGVLKSEIYRENLLKKEI